ncbi:MAG: hypothetical protein ACPGUI_00405 [Halarcobacter sp.]
MRPLLMLLICLNLGFSKTNNTVDNDYSSKDIEVGKHFYQDPKKEKETTPFDNVKLGIEQQIQNELLREIKTLRKEVQLIKWYINPNAPHKIKCSDGTYDWANSRQECFEMPIITEGRNLPALSAFMQNPTEENAANWLGVQAKLFNQATKMGYAIKFAFLKGGKEVYPTTTTNLYPSYGSISAAKQNLLKKELIKRYDQNLGTVIFLGETIELEKEVGFERLSRILLRDGDLLNPLIIFKNQDIKDAYDTFYSLKDKNSQLRMAYDNTEQRIFPEMFEKYNVTITPTVMALYEDKKTNKSIKSIIAKGFTNKDTVINGLVQFLVFNDLLDPKELNVEDKWRNKNDN